jgi:YYY domain-containing protein
MTAFILWYLIIASLGWLTFPLAHRLFPLLPDRGFALSRALGLLIWGYVFWLFGSFGIAQNDVGGMLLALALLVALSAWSFTAQRAEVLDFVRSRWVLVLVTELLFLATFGFMAFVRSANPELASTEKPMELAFISGIMRSPSFPPQDPWLSGYAISYYYFGYVMTAMLAILTNVPATMAHNLMTSLIFGLAAAGSFGIVYNLLSKTRTEEDVRLHPWVTALSSLVAPLFLLLVSNFGALLEALHRYGFFWVRDPATGTLSSSFWTWLDVKELSSPPVEPFGWEPERYLWWWRSSRVLQDYDMLGNPLEVIDEFPFFSFLLGDLHPHVLAIPFALLAISVALHIYLGGWRGEINLFGLRLHITPEGFFLAALVLGGLAFLNTWDILVAAALIVFAYVFTRARESGWGWRRFEDLFVLGIPLAVASILLYIPFYFGFSSQAGGVYPSLMYPSRGAHLWVMWGTLLIPIYGYLIYLVLGERIHASWKVGLSVGLGFVLLMWIVSWLIAVAGYYLEKDLVLSILASQQMDIPTFFRATSLRRLNYIGGLITMLGLLIPALALLFQKPRETDEELQTFNEPASSLGDRWPGISFVLLLCILGVILIMTPDFVYLRDQFGYRINTVFKFYYQAWILLSLVASFGAAYVLQRLQGWRDWLYRALIVLVIFCGLLYPTLGLMTKTNRFKPYDGFTLDDLDRVRRENPDDAAAIEWLRNAPDGVIVEAVGDGYSAYGRISANTGMQTLLGWPGHEAQWRGTFEPQGSRRDDVGRLYTTTSWDEARNIIEQYHVRYIYIGTLERVSLSLNEEKFITHLNPVFQQGTVVIYEVPQN